MEVTPGYLGEEEKEKVIICPATLFSVLIVMRSPNNMGSVAELTKGVQVKAYSCELGWLGRGSIRHGVSWLASLDVK